VLTLYALPVHWPCAVQCLLCKQVVCCAWQRVYCSLVNVAEGPTAVVTAAWYCCRLVWCCRRPTTCRLMCYPLMAAWQWQAACQQQQMLVKLASLSRQCWLLRSICRWAAGQAWVAAAVCHAQSCKCVHADSAMWMRALSVYRRHASAPAVCPRRSAAVVWLQQLLHCYNHASLMLLQQVWLTCNLCNTLESSCAVCGMLQLMEHYLHTSACLVLASVVVASGRLPPKLNCVIQNLMAGLRKEPCR
jgi:hypothetical protein